MRTHITLSLALLASAASAQNWTLISGASAPNTNPPGTNFAEMVYDASRGMCVLFGGWSPSTGWNTVADTYEYNGTAWTLMQPATTPPERAIFGMAFDLARARTVAFGGYDNSGTMLGDTWEWDGSNWTQVTPAVSPSARGECQMVYDIARGVCVLFGGWDGSQLTDTWEFNGSTWVQVITAFSPPPLYYFAMAYDVLRGKTVIYGGYDFNTGSRSPDTYEYDGTNWVKAAPINSPVPVSYAEMCYDWNRGQCILFGGYDAAFVSTNDCFGYDGTTWNNLNASTGSTAMTGRDSHAMCYDFARGVNVLDGGYVDLRETLELGGGGAQASWVPFGQGCQGSNGVPGLAPAPGSLPQLGSTFSVDCINLPVAPGVAYVATGFSDTMWLGNPLPLNLGAFGFAGCTAYNDSDPNLGMLVIHGGSSAVVNYGVPNNAALAGLVFFQQLYSFDSGAANGKLANSNAGKGTVN